MKHAFILFLPAFICLAGCKDKHEANFTIHLQTYVGSQPLSFSNTTYTDGAGKDFFFSKLKFYASHFRLVKSDNTEVEIKDAAYFDWSDNTWKSVSAQVEAGTYKGLKFWVGLDPQQNATNPDNYPANTPLGPKPDMFWTWLKHRFIVLEGTADTTGNNFGGGVVGLVYHTGRDTCYREVSLTGSDIVVNAGSTKSINLNLDLLKVFTNPPTPIDMFSQPGTQSEDADLNVAIQFSNQFANSFSYTE
jgi:hypothetical protein